MEKITDLMNLRGRYPVLMGATHPMQSTTIPAISEGAKFIVKEAMKKDERPLYRITGSFDWFSHRNFNWTDYL